VVAAQVHIRIPISILLGGVLRKNMHGFKEVKPNYVSINLLTLSYEHIFLTYYFEERLAELILTLLRPPVFYSVLLTYSPY
jgi:hypothetical protein